MAHAARDDPDQHLAGLWIVDQDRLNDDRSAGFVDDRPDRFARHLTPVASAGLPILPRVDAGTLRDIAHRRCDGFVAALEEMVNVDCGSYTPDGVNVIADLCDTRFVSNGWEVERRPHRAGDGDPAQLGDLVIGRLRGAGGPNVLLVGHMDTVFDEGTVARRPFRIEGDIARGPGVSDMKGGLLTGFVATEVLQEAGFDGFGTITYVCNPDEEIGSPYSGPVIRELAPQHDAAFVLEGARANGDIVSARKGITDYRITITGRAAHAGVEPEKGRNAVLEAAHEIVALQGLNGRWPGVTVNVGVVQGGTRTNVVAERCELQVDLAPPCSRRSRKRKLRSNAAPRSRRARRDHGRGRPRVASPMEKKEGAARCGHRRRG